MMWLFYLCAAIAVIGFVLFCTENIRLIRNDEYESTTRTVSLILMAAGSAAGFATAGLIILEREGILANAMTWFDEILRIG